MRHLATVLIFCASLLLEIALVWWNISSSFWKLSRIYLDLETYVNSNNTSTTQAYVYIWGDGFLLTNEELHIIWLNYRLRLYTRLDARYCLLCMATSKDLQITWGDCSLGIPMEQSFQCNLFGKVNTPCLKGGTLPLNNVRVGFYLGLVGCI